MKMVMIKLMMMINTMMPFMKNPMSMGALLLMQTMLMVNLNNKISQSSWLAMITFLMMIGGLLIIFSYISSIASNEKFKLNINVTFLLVSILMVTDEFILETQINENQEISCNKFMDLSMIKIYGQKSMFMTILLVIYLLVTMISVSKIVNHHKGPLRSFKN
uniref:NADH dehydrogenase subunit 6 n=1 Tax=Empoasca sp. EMHAU_031203 TaxID=2036854 RepID=A0A343K197_9HEMI|nr:NADH dehydrogenase subunit 6 [Empoasca sp. EMHAU_031203]